MRRKNHMAPARIILIGFALLILAGALLLTLPISTRDGQGAAFFDALFTATSATCVTGWWSRTRRCTGPASARR